MKEYAIYINVPFCKTPCSYCHYVENLSFGYHKVPEEYFEMLIKQLESVLIKLQGSHLDSIYFGGGTPSLLSDCQCDRIFALFQKYRISSDEVSMEIHPGMCNFDYVHNCFFTRYSIGVQSFDEEIKTAYRRNSYSRDSVVSMFRKIRTSSVPRQINIDLIFEEKIQDCDIDFVNLLKPETVTFYPNTKGRGKARLISVIHSLDQLKDRLQGYHALGKSRFIYVKDGQKQSFYSKLEYEKIGNIIGIGHNSISYWEDTSFLCRYENGQIIEKARKSGEGRRIHSLMMGISSGVTTESIKKYLPEAVKGHFFYTMEDIDILDKHSKAKEKDLVYVPESEYVRFYCYLQENGWMEFARTFLASIGYGDGDWDVISYVYNKALLLEEQEAASLKNKLGVIPREKITAPSIKILIEGIDGSGKDTFAQLLMRQLKRRFLFDNESRISITGEPNSAYECGKEAKKFIEDLQYDGNWPEVKEVLRKNRIATEKELKAIPGIMILIRGLVTDKATFSHVFEREEDLGEGEEIKKWDRFIVIDTPPETAEERIRKRNEPRTWREYIEHLRYFREYYLKYNSDLFLRKQIIQNTSLAHLNKTAQEMADEIYAEAYKSR